MEELIEAVRSEKCLYDVRHQDYMNTKLKDSIWKQIAEVLNLKDGVFACCNGDTWASEFGTVLSKSDPFLITNWRRVPKGTNGGITFIGTLLSTVGGLVVGFAHYLGVMYFSDSAMLGYSPPQWPVMVFGALGGFLGSLIDSLLGATLQYSGQDKNGRIVSHSTLAVKHISGHNVLDNHSVNLISTVIMGLLMPTISKVLWPAI